MLHVTCKMLHKNYISCYFLQVFQAAYNWIVHDIPARRCYVFEILSHVRLRLCSLARLERIILECKDASLIVALRSIQKDLVSNKGCLVPLHAQPRICARKNILVIGGSKREHSADSWGRTAESTYETIEKYDIFTGYNLRRHISFFSSWLLSWNAID